MNVTSFSFADTEQWGGRKDLSMIHVDRVTGHAADSVHLDNDNQVAVKLVGIHVQRKYSQMGVDAVFLHTNSLVWQDQRTSCCMQTSTPYSWFPWTRTLRPHPTFCCMMMSPVTLWLWPMMKPLIPSTGVIWPGQRLNGQKDCETAGVIETIYVLL